MERDCESELSKLNIEQNACIYHFGASVIHGQRSNILRLRRKNWLFSASPKGAASSAIVYTMVEMAKANDLNTYKYLTYLLSQRPDAKMSDEQLEQLAPWSETAKANCQN